MEPVAGIGDEAAVRVDVQAHLRSIRQIRGQMRLLRTRHELPPRVRRVADDPQPHRRAQADRSQAEVGAGHHQELLRRVAPRIGCGARAKLQRVCHGPPRHAEAGGRVEDFGAWAAEQRMALICARNHQSTTI